MRDPRQRVDRRQDLHRERLVARLALLADDQVADVVRLVDQDLRGALEIPPPVLQSELSPEGLNLGDRVDDALDLIGWGDRNGADPLARGGIE